MTRRIEYRIDNGKGLIVGRRIGDDAWDVTIHGDKKGVFHTEVLSSKSFGIFLLKVGAPDSHVSMVLEGDTDV